MFLKLTFLIHASLQLYFMCTFLQIFSYLLPFPKVFKTNVFLRPILTNGLDLIFKILPLDWGGVQIVQ